MLDETDIIVARTNHHSSCSFGFLFTYVFEGTSTADAAMVVAGKLDLGLEIAPGVEGTVIYNKDGTLGDFVREGLNPQYWYLAVEDDKLHLHPFVKTSLATVSSEQGLYYSDHPQE